MWINRHAVRQLHTLQSPILVLREHHTPAPRPIDVEPEAVCFTHCSNSRERVVGTEDGGTSARVDIERCVALGFGFYHGSLKFYDPQNRRGLMIRMPGFWATDEGFRDLPETIIFPARSTGIDHTASLPNPHIIADFSTL